MNIRIGVVLIATMLGACNSAPSLQETYDAFDRRNAELKARQRADAAAREAQLLKEQAELKRVLDERKRREASPTAQIHPIAETGVDGKALADPAAALRMPDDLLAQRSVYYDYDAYTVKTEYEPTLQAHAELLRSRPDLQLTVEGNCDERGSREYNLALGQRRADAVKRALVLLGVSAQQVSTVSFGSEKPKAAGNSEDELAQNRRSDLVYAGMAQAK